MGTVGDRAGRRQGIAVAFRIAIDETPETGLARVVREQVEKLRRDLDDNDVSVAEKVRRARVRCKRVRAVLALGRRMMGDKAWRRQNRWWRDAARSLSDVRDLSARVEALDAARADMGVRVSDLVVGRLRAWFELDRVAREGEWDVREALKRFAARLRDAPTPDFSHGKHDDEVCRGYRRSYNGARKAMLAAAEGDDAERYHRWRKKVKSLGLQARLLRETHPKLEAHVSAGRELSSVLGMAQDIDVVVDVVAADGSLPVSSEEAEMLSAALIGRRDQLFAEALALAGRVLPEEKVAFEPVRESA